MTSEHADLQAQRDRLLRLFQASPVPQFVLDPAGIVLHTNRRARHTVGHTAEALQGSPFLDLVDPAWKPALLRRMERVRVERLSLSADTGLMTADGKTLFARLEATRVDDPGGPLLLVAVLVLTEDTANLQLVGDTFDTTRDRVRALSARYDRS